MPMLIQKNIYLLMFFFVFFVATTATPKKNEDIFEKIKNKKDLQSLSNEVFSAAQFGGLESVKDLFKKNELKSSERCAVLRLSAQIAEKEGAKITSKMLEAEHDRIVSTRGWYLRGAGCVGSAIGTIARFGFSPIKKGFDGACYAVGGVTGIASVAGFSASIAVFLTYLGLTNNIDLKKFFG